jgi:hypothetical protein
MAMTSAMADALGSLGRCRRDRADMAPSLVPCVLSCVLASAPFALAETRAGAVVGGRSTAGGLRPVALVLHPRLLLCGHPADLNTSRQPQPDRHSTRQREGYRERRSFAPHTTQRPHKHTHTLVAATPTGYLANLERRWHVTFPFRAVQCRGRCGGEQTHTQQETHASARVPFGMG